MDQTSCVINVLDDSRERSIEFQNRLWLRQNIEKLNIHVCVEDCLANIFDIAKEWDHEGTIIIQEGQKIQIKNDFEFSKEALLLIKDESKNAYYVFLYSSKK